MPLSREQVVWAYRILLDRDPEGEEVIAPKMRTYETTQALRHDLVTSLEYQEKNPDIALADERTLVMCEIEDGLRLWLDLADRAIGLNIARGRYELNEVDFLRRVVRPGASVIDCGAHVGYFAMHLGRLVGPEGTVAAFEPLDGNADCLERSVKENAFDGRVQVKRAAVGARTGVADLVLASGAVHSGGAFLRRPGEGLPSAHAARPVRTVALDDCPLRRPVSVIKADIEGAEPLAFRGAARLLREDRPIILSELHPYQLERVSGDTAAAFIAEMASAGYACHLLGAGTAGAQIDDAPSNGVTSVVFLPSGAAVRETR